MAVLFAFSLRWFCVLCGSSTVTSSVVFRTNKRIQGAGSKNREEHVQGTGAMRACSPVCALLLLGILSSGKLSACSAAASTPSAVLAFIGEQAYMKRGHTDMRPDIQVAHWFTGTLGSQSCILIQWGAQITGLHVDSLGHPDHGLHTDSLGHPDHGVAHQSLAISTILMMLVDCLWARNCSVSPLLCWVYTIETKFVLLYYLLLLLLLVLLTFYCSLIYQSSGSKHLEYLTTATK